MRDVPGPTTAVLVADDDENLRASVRTALEREGYRVLEARDGLEAREALRLRPAQEGLQGGGAAEAGPGLIVLDISMPRLNGLDLLRELRAGGDRIPVIFLTSRDEELDRVLGLELGADDYLPKPFSLRELAARVRAVLRRSELRAAGTGSRGDRAAPDPAAPDSAMPQPASAAGEGGRLVLDRDGFRAFWDGRELDLTVTEFRILECLADRPGTARTRESLIARAYPGEIYLSDRVIDCHIKRLRRKVREAGSAEDPIETLYGLGYRLRV